MSVQDPEVPPTSESRYLAGLSAFEDGRYGEAVDHFLACLGTIEDPRIQRLGKNYLGETYSKLGAQNLRDREFARALDFYSMAISQAPSYPDYHLGRARAHAGLGNRVEHEQALSRALDLHPQYADALLALAAYRYPLAPQEGLDLFEKACQASEDLFGEPYQAVQAAHRVMDLDKVVTTLLSLRSPGASQANALAATAAEHVRQGRTVEAEAAYNRALQLAPRYADIRCKYGQLLNSMDRYLDAISELQTAVEINPRYVEALTHLGIALIRNGQEHEGSESLMRALEIDPLHPVASAEAARISTSRSRK